MKTQLLFVMVFAALVAAGADKSKSETVATPHPDEAAVPIDVESHVNSFINANPQIVAAAAVTPAAESGVAEDAPSPQALVSVTDSCECAVFNTEAPTGQDKPILTQAPMSVTCNPVGEDNCNKLCTALAEAAKERGPQLLCATLGHYTNLKASVHSRICGVEAWKYTGLTSPTAICCHEHQVIDCKQQVEKTGKTANQL